MPLDQYMHATLLAVAHSCDNWHLVIESKVEPLVPLICCRREVIKPLFRRHRAPFAVTLFVAPHVVGLYQPVDHNVHAQKGEQLPIATDVARLVVCARQLSSINHGEKSAYRCGICWTR